MTNSTPEALNDWPEAGIQAAVNFLKAVENKTLSMVDVGGHRGETLAAMVKNVGQFSYQAFEPNPDSFKALMDYANTIKDDVRKIDIYNAAVGAEDGSVEFHVTQGTAVSGILKPVDGLSERVPSGDHIIEQSIQCDLMKIDSLEDVVAGNVFDLLKIDTEGFDLEVMKGAEKALRNGQFKAVLSEAFFVPYRDQQAYFWDLASYMQSMGYHFVNLYDCRDTTQGRLYTGNALWLSPDLAIESGFL